MGSPSQVEECRQERTPFFAVRFISYKLTPGKPFGKIIGNTPILKKQSDEVLERGFLSNIGVVVFLDEHVSFLGTVEISNVLLSPKERMT